MDLIRSLDAALFRFINLGLSNPFFDRIMPFFSGNSLFVPLLIILGAFTTGYLFAGRDPKRREVLGLGTGQRNIAAATVVASQSFGASSTIMTVVLTSLVGLATLFAIAWWLRQRRRERHPQPSPPR